MIHWIGAIRMPDARLEDLVSVLADYDRYDRFYRPMIYECRTVAGAVTEVAPKGNRVGFILPA